MRTVLLCMLFTRLILNTTFGYVVHANKSSCKFDLLLIY